MEAAGFLVRAAGEEDLATVVAIERGIGEAPHWGEGEYAGILRQDSESGVVRRCLLVAEASGGLVGFAVGKVIDLGGEVIAELESVAVEPDARGVGVGTALCEAVVAWSRVQGAGAVELEVRDGNEGAIGLYSGLGFVVSGRRRGYYSEPIEDAVLMRLDLGSGKK